MHIHIQSRNKISNRSNYIEKTQFLAELVIIHIREASLDLSLSFKEKKGDLNGKMTISKRREFQKSKMNSIGADVHKVIESVIKS